MNFIKFMKKMKLILYILGVFFCLFILIFVSEYTNVLKIIIYSLILPFFLFSPLYITTFFIKLGAKKSYKANLSKIDFSKDKDYYRDIIKYYSPAELSYIDNLKPLEEKDVCATLLSLKLKEKIKIDKKIEIIDDSFTSLNYTECYVLSRIKNGKVKNINLKAFTIEAEREAKEHNLAKKNFQNKIPKDIIIIILTYIAMYILYKINNTLLEGTNNNIFLEIVYLINLLLSLVINYGKYFIIGYIVVRILSYSRTTKGEEINVKLEGLKNYIKDFGNFENKEIKQLPLWEEYLIYSVMFNINKSAINKLKKLID